MSTSVCYPPSTDWGCVEPEWLAELDANVRDRAEMLAWSTLASLSGYQFATCPLVVRPCRKACAYGPVTWAPAPAYGYGSGSFTPHINGAGYWVNTCLCGADPCSCTQIREITLPGQVGAVVEVRINGGLIDPSVYRVDNGNKLVRQDGEDWPICQDMNASLGEEDTWSVTYYQGIAPNALLDFAAGVLAKEYALACLGSECRLPSNVTAISRQGVSYQMNADPFVNGFTGIDEVDAVLRIYNPNGLKSGPVIASPDHRGRARVTTWTR
jgi:hypothetical protein